MLSCKEDSNRLQLRILQWKSSIMSKFFLASFQKHVEIHIYIVFKEDSNETVWLALM